METEIKQRLISAIAKKFEIPESEIVPDAKIKETLDLDSLGIVDLLVIIEDTCNTRVTADNLIHFTYFRDIFSAL